MGVTERGRADRVAPDERGLGATDHGGQRARAVVGGRPGGRQTDDEQRRDEGTTRAVPRHVACVMDGNGRWAQRRSLPRAAGHRAAETTVIDIIEAARASGVERLSLYAFSTENWNRPGSEVDYLMRLVRRVVRKHAPLLLARGIRCRFLGAADPRIPRELARDFDDLATLTAVNQGMTPTVAFDHGGRRDIVEAARSLIRSGTPADEVTERLFADRARAAGVPLTWVGGAPAFHQHHPVSDPPVAHLSDVLRNAGTFHRRWGWWPMTDWLHAFADRGLAHWNLPPDVGRSAPAAVADRARENGATRKAPMGDRDHVAPKSAMLGPAESFRYPGRSDAGQT